MHWGAQNQCGLEFWLNCAGTNPREVCPNGRTSNLLVQSLCSYWNRKVSSHGITRHVDALWRRMGHSPGGSTLFNSPSSLLSPSFDHTTPHPDIIRDMFMTKEVDSPLLFIVTSTYRIVRLAIPDEVQKGS